MSKPLKYVIWLKRKHEKKWSLRMGRYLGESAALDAVSNFKKNPANTGIRWKVLRDRVDANAKVEA